MICNYANRYICFFGSTIFTIGDGFTFGSWKGIQWVREYFIPANPKTEKQVNVRTAMKIAVAYWTNSFSGTQKEYYNDEAVGKKLTERPWLKVGK